MKKIIIISSLFLLMSVPALSYANPIANILPSGSTVNSQGEALKNKQETKVELQQKQNQLLRDIDALNIDIQELERQEQELQNKITGLNDSLKNLSQVNTKSDDQSINEQKTISEDNIKKELDQAKITLIDVQKQLTEKQGTLEANRQAIVKIDTQIQEASVAVEAQKDEFLGSIISTIGQYTPYIIGVIIAFLSYLIIKRINRKYSPPAITDLISVAINVIYILGLGIMITYLFIGQFGNLFTLISLFSAALVVALQDFISSFFAWIFIKARNKFKEGDIIQIAGFSGNNQYSGRVKKIEAFRTLLVENEGTMEGEKIDKERVTGRIVSIPNNMFLKQPVINSTQENRIVWQTLDLIITFKSDWQKAKTILQKVINRIYTPEYIKEHKITKQHTPQIYLSIADQGVRLSIWFPASVGTYRDTLQRLSEESLIEFTKHHIDLAYNTLTVEMGG